MTTTSSRTFRSGNSEAVRLPREVAFGRDIDVTIVRSGEVLTIYPKKFTTAQLIARLADLPRPDAIEVRGAEPIPEREGL